MYAKTWHNTAERPLSNKFKEQKNLDAGMRKSVLYENLLQKLEYAFVHHSKEPNFT